MKQTREPNSPIRRRRRRNTCIKYIKVLTNPIWLYGCHCMAHWLSTCFGISYNSKVFLLVFSYISGIQLMGEIWNVTNWLVQTRVIRTRQPACSQTVAEFSEKLAAWKIGFLRSRIWRQQGPSECQYLFSNRYGFIPEDLVHFFLIKPTVALISQIYFVKKVYIRGLEL